MTTRMRLHKHKFAPIVEEQTLKEALEEVYGNQDTWFSEGFELGLQVDVKAGFFMGQNDQNNKYDTLVLDFYQTILSDIEHALQYFMDDKLRRRNIQIRNMLLKSVICYSNPHVDEKGFAKAKAMILALVSNDKEELIFLCRDLLNKYKDLNMLIFVSLVLFDLARQSSDTDLMRDAFIIASFSNIINPCLTEYVMFSIGQQITCDFLQKQAESEWVFMEFVFRKIGTCNTSLIKVIDWVEPFSTLLTFNIESKKRPSIEGQDTVAFLEDLKCINRKSYKLGYSEQNLSRFKKDKNMANIYRSLNNIYSDHNNDTFYTRAHKLSNLCNLVKTTGVQMDYMEKFIALCNCVHNFHVILQARSLNPSFKANIDVIIDGSQLFSIEAYDSVIHELCEAMRHHAMPLPNNFPNFNSTVMELFLTSVEQSKIDPIGL